MKDNRHRINLTLTYLAIIMVLSLTFSAMFYREATRAAGSGFRHQVTQLRGNLFFTSPRTLDRIRDEGIERFNQNVLNRLIFLNLIMLAAGAVLSYYLAKISLEPLEEALESQSRFTSDAAHELRTPLTAMKAENEIALRTKTLSGKETKQIFASNLEEITKLQALTDSLLRLARNDELPDTDYLKDVNLTEVLSAAAERIKPLAKAKKISFIIPKAEELMVNGDEAQLTDLFVILFDNAVKYGKEKTSVEVYFNKDARNVVVEVKDHGIGINSKDLPNIFERFYRADQSRAKATAEGYGLGLSVAKAIVNNHKGLIKVTSKLDKGTTFTVTLPRSRN